MKGEVMHHAACHDCKLYKWGDDEEDAKEMAISHTKNFDHLAYIDSAEVPS